MPMVLQLPGAWAARAGLAELPLHDAEAWWGLCQWKNPAVGVEAPQEEDDGRLGQGLQEPGGQEQEG